MDYKKYSIKRFLESKNKTNLSNNLNDQIILKRNICDNEKEKLKERLIIKKKLEKRKEEPNQRLKDKIENHQLKIGDLEAEINNIKSLFLQSTEITNIALSELRKIDQKKANEIEFTIALKKPTKK
ncbi:hypothetical protein P0E94_001886 [Vibrio metschnikovii]|nr:hypothetical protein [Vibrio metschnikovii]